MEILPYILNGLFLALLVIQIFYRYANKRQIETIIKNHYKSQSAEVQNIVKLTITERLKYGVPLNFIFSMYNFFFTIFTRLGKNHFRKIEILNKEHKEEIVYVDLYIKKRKLIEIKEFEKYQF